MYKYVAFSVAAIAWVPDVTERSSIRLGRGLRKVTDW